MGRGDMDDKTITIAVVNDGDDEGAEEFRVTLASPGGGAIIEGSPSIDVTIDDGAVIGPPLGGGGGGGGSGVLELLGLLAMCLLVAQTQQQAHRRAHDRAHQVRLRNHRDT